MANTQTTPQVALFVASAGSLRYAAHDIDPASGQPIANPVYLVDLNGNPFSVPLAATGTKSNVAGSASSVTILASNTNRKGAMIYNDSTAILYLDLSGGTASSSSYSVQVSSQGFFELPGPTIYNGAITGIWASANGSARVTEFS